MSVPAFSKAPTFELSSSGAQARAQVWGGQFVVLASSTARAEVVDSYEKYVPSGYRQLRAALIASGRRRRSCWAAAPMARGNDSRPCRMDGGKPRANGS